MDKTPNYSAEQEAFIRAFKGSGTNGALTKDDAATIANSPVMFVDGAARKPRSIIAKITRMADVAYEKAVPTRKDGSAVESKAKLVEQIAGMANVTFEGLANAPRGDLVKLRDYLRAA